MMYKAQEPSNNKSLLHNFLFLPEKANSYLMIHMQIFHLEATCMTLKSEGKLKKV